MEIARAGLGSLSPKGAHMERYTVERGSGSSGTAYNFRDHEVIDTARTGRNRVMCRATGSDARAIAAALNAAGGNQ